MSRAQWLEALERMVKRPRVIDGFLQADTSKLSIHDMRAVGKLLPHLVACARFVEEHTELLGLALAFTEANPCNAAEYNEELRRALRELEALRRLTADRGTDG